MFSLLASTPASTVRFEGFHGASYLLLVAGIIALAVFLLAFGYRWLRTRPELPHAGPETNDLGSNPEPPAVVNLLVNRWRVSRSAVAATLVDLAARRVLGRDLVGHDGTVVRLRDTPAAGSLSPYAQQVYELVKRRATGGSAPIEALDLGEAGEAEAWWKRFRKAVVKDARARGVARNRWERIDWLIIGIGLAIVLGLLALAFGTAHVGEHPGTKGSMSPSDWLGAAFFGWFGGIALVAQFQDITDTSAGRAVCARWLGVRNELRNSHAFDGQPPASVTIWERYLAFGVALGVAHDAARGLPLTAEDPHSAWTRNTGAWREIHIDYPSHFGYGERPLGVFFKGAVTLVFWGAIGFVILPVVVTIAWGIARDELKTASVSSSALNGVVAVVAGLIAVVGIYLFARILTAAIRTTRGALDLGRTRTLEGEVVKVHLGHFAVDDGHAVETKALLMPPGPVSPQRGARVRATITPHLHYLSKIEVLKAAPADAAVPLVAADAGPTAFATAIAAMRGTAPAAGPAAMVAGAPVHLALDAAMLQQATGLNLQPSANGPGPKGPAGDFGPVQLQTFEDGHGNRLSVGLSAANPAFAGAFTLLAKLPTSRGTQVEGLGERAYWMRERSLMVQNGTSMLFVDVDFPRTATEERLQAARAVAKAVLAGPAQGS